ncbi:MAG: protease complex subunit PrcB family protein [Flavobacteriaceae bacterium]|jgi:hypothetical protein|nr:protease complex subunit PrcB family protein [Flavobacteriaceae bacterium]
MRKVFLMAILSIVLVSCNNDDNGKQSFIPQTITPVLIALSDLLGVAIFSIPDEDQYNNYFNNENDWENFLNNNSALSFYPEIGNIDFNNDIVIVCVDYTKPTFGYSIGFNSIIEYENEVIVSIKYEGNGGVATMPSRPFIIVKIPKTEKPIVFE